MNYKNVMKLGLGSLVCASVLSACADGRGSNGFKSYQFSAEEKATNLAEKTARDAALNPTDPNKNSGNDDSAQSEGGDGKSKPGDIKPGTDQGASVFKPIDATDAAKQKLITEELISAEPEQQVAAPVQDLNVTIENEVSKGPNLAAIDQVKGITVTPSGSANAMTLSLQAVVSVGGEDLYMDASEVPVKFLKPEEQVQNMLFRLNKPCDQGVVQAKNLLWAAAKCQDEKCASVEVVLSFLVTGGRANAIIRLTQNSSGWAIDPEGSNIGSPKSFVEAQALIPACEAAAAPAAPVPAAPVEGANETAPSTNSGGPAASSNVDPKSDAVAKAKAARDAKLASQQQTYKKLLFDGKSSAQAYALAYGKPLPVESKPEAAKPVVRDARQVYMDNKAAAQAKAAAEAKSANAQKAYNKLIADGKTPAEAKLLAFGKSAAPTSTVVADADSKAKAARAQKAYEKLIADGKSVAEAERLAFGKTERTAGAPVGRVK